MLKKVCVCLLMGSVALSSAACGDNGIEQKSPKESLAISYEKKSTTESQDALYKTIFNNSLFVGDSMTERLKSGDFLDDKNVVAEMGGTTIKALHLVDEIAKRKPEHIFISLGNNDLVRFAERKDKPAEGPIKFVTSSYSQLLKKIKEKLPNAKIHVLSVTPVSEEALKIGPEYKDIGHLNAALKELANAEKVDFIDLSPIFEKHKVPYLDEREGVHFTDDYYPLLLEYLKDIMK
ncbi:GDSL-type esterase/lipase family protein [Brevibacillus sp. 179-C9.3 HS]|uniref:GDSL-type esterase/lipase family protein n=1 Tax=unclassified Brevibacillus TaxID=2684853 RepID=UPI0039A169CB